MNKKSKRGNKDEVHQKMVNYLNQSGIGSPNDKSVISSSRVNTSKRMKSSNKDDDN